MILCSINLNVLKKGLDKNIKILSFTQSKKSVNDFLHLVRENKKYQMFTQDFNIETIFKIFVYDKHNMYSNSKAKYDLLIFSFESWSPFQF